MAGTNLFTPVTSTLWVALSEGENMPNGDTQLAMFAKCTGTPPTTANLFEHGCLITQTDKAAASPAIFQNTGTSAVPVWTLIDTALPGDTASSLIDTNSVTALDVGTTASAVNNLRVTNSAAGLVSANAVLLSAVGTDAAISIQVSPKGATGLLTLGLATGTGTITVGSSSSAQTVAIGAGAGVPTVSIANVSTVGANVNIATAAATAVGNTVNIGTGATTLAGGNTIHIGDGTPTGAGTNLITIGSLANTANTTTIQGGSGATAIALTPQTTGIITVGASTGTGDVVVGSSSATQTVKVGNGAGVSTVNLANVSVAGANVNMATAVTGAGITDTVAISTGNAAATGIKVVNILTGTPGTSGNNRLTLGGGVTTKFTTNATATMYQAPNQTTGSAVANAPVATLTDASGANITVATGLRVLLTLGSTLQAGANTLNLNAHGADAIKMHSNAASDLGVGYAATGIVDLLFNGTVWLDMSQ